MDYRLSKSSCDQRLADRRSRRFFYFSAHSVVEKEDGTMMDITPSDPGQAFLRPEGREEQFFEIRSLSPRLRFPKNEEIEEPTRREDEGKFSESGW